MGIFSYRADKITEIAEVKSVFSLKDPSWTTHAIDLIDPIIAALPDPALVIDVDTHIISANAAARVFIPSIAIGEPLSRSLRAVDLLDVVMRVLAGAPAEKTAWTEKAAVERRYEAYVAPLNIQGYKKAALISLHDLTEAHRIARMRVDFVANASHELRTPLASILGFVETLQGPAKNDTAARDKFLRIMRDQASRMSRLVDDLLSLSNIEQHMHVCPSTPVDLTLLVEHIVDTLAPMTEGAEAPIKLNLIPDIIVPGDRDELARVLENLIENALKYGESDFGNKPIEISLVQQGKFAVFQVRDHGPGIAPEHVPRLTERFYRVDAGKSRAKGGTGLGLAIVKHIILRHRGRLLIESTLGEGSTFRIVIPALS